MVKQKVRQWERQGQDRDKTGTGSTKEVAYREK